MDCYLNVTIPVRIQSMVGPKAIIQADKGMTAGGLLRADVSKLQREWQIETSKLTDAEWAAIYNHLASVMFTETLWWHTDLGGTASTNSIYAEVTFDDPKLIQFGRNGTWSNSGRTASMTIRESR